MSRRIAPDASNYFIGKQYKCQEKCVYADFWNEARIKAEPHNGSYAVMKYISNKYIESKKEKILDVGCGPSSKIGLFFDGCLVTGIDSEYAISIAKKNNPKGRYYICDLDSDESIDCVSVQLDKYDIIMCIDVIEHVLFPEKMLRLIKRHATSGTKVFISTLERDISRGIGSYKIGSSKLEHVREWNEKEFSQFIQNEGFAIHEIILTPLSMSDNINASHMRIQTLFCTVCI